MKLKSILLLVFCVGCASQKGQMASFSYEGGETYEIYKVANSHGCRLQIHVENVDEQGVRVKIIGRIVGQGSKENISETLYVRFGEIPTKIPTGLEEFYAIKVSRGRLLLLRRNRPFRVVIIPNS